MNGAHVLSIASLSIGIILFIILIVRIKNDIDLKNEREANIKKANKEHFDSIMKEADLSSQRTEYFNNYKLPSYILDRFVKDYPKYFIMESEYSAIFRALCNKNECPEAISTNYGNVVQLSKEERLALIEEALMDYFSIFLKNQKAFFNFPSLVADDLWHTFILFTKDYREFCEKSFGKIIDHEPHTDKEPDKADFKNLLNTFNKLNELNGAKAFQLDKLFNVKNIYDFDYMLNISTELDRYISARKKSFKNESSYSSIDTNLLLSVGLISALDLDNNVRSQDNEPFKTVVACGTGTSCGSTSNSKASSCGSSYSSSSSSSTSSSCGSSSSCGGGCGGGG